MRAVSYVAGRLSVQILCLSLFVGFISPFCATVGSTETVIMTAWLQGVWRRVSGVFRGPEMEELPKYTFPDTLEGFGYQFNKKGELLNKDGGKFQFVVKEGDRNYNQQHYDALGEVVTDYLYNIMENDLKLQRIIVPVDVRKEEVHSFIFRSEDALENDKLMVLIHGSGAVRAGQWSRKLIINEDIDTGSQLPYIRRAISDGYGVIVLNPNLNEAIVNGKTQPIRGNSSPKEHGVYVWRKFVSQAKAKNIVIVAHSFGGIVTCSIAEEFLKDFKERVFSVVFTDSVHSADRALWSQQVKEFMKERAVNFASAYVPLNTMLQASSEDDCLSVSAGTEQHERTSHSCFDSAFKFIRDNAETWTKEGKMAPRDFLPLPEDLDQYSPARRWEKMQAAEASKKQGEKGQKGDKSSKKEEKAKTSAAKQDEEQKAKNGGAPETENGASGTGNAEVKTEGGETEKNVVEPEASPDNEQSKLSTDDKQEKASPDAEQDSVSTDAELGKTATGTEPGKVNAEKEQGKTSPDDEQGNVSTDAEPSKVSTSGEQAKVNTENEQGKASPDGEQDSVSAGTEPGKMDEDIEPVSVSTGDGKGEASAEAAEGEEREDVAQKVSQEKKELKSEL